MEKTENNETQTNENAEMRREDLQKKIVDALNQIDDVDFLRMLYKRVKKLYEEEKNRNS